MNTNSLPASLPRPKKVSTFESKPCGRCGGGGRFGPACVYGGICFKCHGRGWNLTKRGAAANAYLVELLSKPASALVPGDVVLYEGFTAGSFTQPSKWCKVEEVSLQASTWKGHEHEQVVVVKTDGCTFHGQATFRVRHTAEEKAPKRAAALIYQSLLTKSGVLAKKVRPVPQTLALTRRVA